MPDHRHELRRQLVTAARERRPGRPAVPAARRVAPLLVAAALLVAVVVVGGGALRSERASAEVFDIRRQGDGSVVIEVIGQIRDPDAAAAELEDLGFDVTLRGVPAPPSLAGHIVSVSVEPMPGAVGPFLATETEEQRVVQFRADAGSRGRVVVDYGRTAGPGEPYGANDTIPDCGDYAGELVTDELVERLAAEYGPSLRWKELAGHQMREVRRDEIDDEARVVSAMGLASDQLLVHVTDGTEAADEFAC